MKNIGIIIFNILLLSCVSIEDSDYYSNIDCPQLNLSSNKLDSKYPLDYIYLIPDYDEDDNYDAIKIPVNQYKDIKYIDLCFYTDDEDDVYTYIDGNKIELDDCILSSFPNNEIDVTDSIINDIYFTSDEFDVEYEKGNFYLNDKILENRMNINLNRNTFSLYSNILITNFSNNKLSKKEVEKLRNNINIECYILNNTTKYDLYDNIILENKGKIKLYSISNLESYKYEKYLGIGYLDYGRFIFPLSKDSKLLFKFNSKYGTSTLEIPIKMNVMPNDNIELTTIIDINDLIKYSKSIVNIKYVLKYKT